MVQVALNGLENILRCGEQDSQTLRSGVNPYAVLIEECYGKFNFPVSKFCKLERNETLNFFLFAGLDKIEFLQSHENRDIYQKAYDIIEHYFGTEEEDSRVAPSVAPDAQQFQFADQSVPMGGFQF